MPVASNIFAPLSTRMKILCVGRNYVDHIRELQNEKPEEPVIFLKPDTALVRHNEPVYHPEFTSDMHHEVEIVLRIGKEGKYIQPEFADRYIDGVGLGIDFTARDVQARLKAKGLPWELAKAFNQSAPVSEFLPVSEAGELGNLDFSLQVNGQLRQQGNTSHMLFNMTELLVFVSRYFTLKAGDLLFTGTPAGVAKVEIGDKLTGFLGHRKMLDFEIR
jgi:2-keto-4-pentenoate hydratase/2-oxohepta-3-ene-1,7-dioic acid hydratase in catechol pathway